ncbi:Oligopeptide transport ATP-binding protein oppD Stage 0 sporulation protein KD [Proteiniborus sp. DW1]|uniref:oligopeptide/dipeptide ABC transporter ATP-binding protein n=1 Tax=Proteiniborus sp. DW1 TaxID=1889883 RepID=UPI00092DF58E|nr:oligopeptide/dipeptide ABC transporter ATP-binding protein [Proteiniborus sp. DW1]SCG83026.1 Oligopeptide transport ATP-binding protein oppD Stage 0 sporulation protein KD [Proteiniborus sp. DW1]
MSKLIDKKKKLIVEDLSISFRTVTGEVKAVRDISFDLYEGETLAIVGESGSGKSVTARAIMGILAGNSIVENGKILYEGEDLLKITEEQFHKIRGSKIGMIYQDPLSSLNPIMKVGKQITEGLLLNGNHLKNKIEKLYNKERIAYMVIKREIGILKEKVKENKKKKLPYEDLKAQISKLKGQLPVAKKNMIEAKKEATKVVMKEYKEEKAKYLEEIKKIRLNSEGLDKEAVKEKIAQKKEELRRVKKVTKKEAKEKAIQVMKEVGIPEPEKRFKQYPFQFSGGMRQRIVIAIVLTANPDVLICDEPTTALDVTIQSQILELIKRLKKERNLSVIFITHDLGVVANIADRVAVMYAGKIQEIGTTEEVFYTPKHPYTWALLGSMPDLTSKDKLLTIPGTPPDMRFPPKGDAFALRSNFAMKIDFEEQPPMFKVSDTHYAATWLLHKNAPAVEMPAILQERILRMKEMTEEMKKELVEDEKQLVY